MAVRAVRGATTVNENSAEAILAATRELIAHTISANKVEHDDIIDMVFTITPDLDKAFPAKAARQLGYTDVPLIDMATPDIEGMLAKCIRLLIHINTEKANKDMVPVYMNGAEVLRPDIPAAE